MAVRARPIRSDRASPPLTIREANVPDATSIPSRAVGEAGAGELMQTIRGSEAEQDERDAREADQVVRADLVRRVGNPGAALVGLDGVGVDERHQFVRLGERLVVAEGAARVEEELG